MICGALLVIWFQCRVCAKKILTVELDLLLTVFVLKQKKGGMVEWFGQGKELRGVKMERESAISVSPSHSTCFCQLIWQFNMCLFNGCRMVMSNHVM